MRFSFFLSTLFVGFELSKLKVGKFNGGDPNAKVFRRTQNKSSEYFKGSCELSKDDYLFFLILEKTVGNLLKFLSKQKFFNWIS